MSLKVEVNGEKVEISPTEPIPIVIEIPEPRKVFLTTDMEGNVTSYIIAGTFEEAEDKNQLEDSMVTTKITPRVLDRLNELFYGDMSVQRRE